jgi:hypothetical protein
VEGVSIMIWAGDIGTGFLLEVHVDLGTTCDMVGRILLKGLDGR